MKSILRTCFLLLLVNISGYSWAQDISQSTLGDRSPLVWADRVAIAYGFSYKHIIQLEEFFKEKGLNPKARKEKVVSLVNRFRAGLDQLEDKSTPPTDSQLKQWLGDRRIKRCHPNIYHRRSESGSSWKNCSNQLWAE